jgi:hypothetical protein
LKSFGATEAIHIYQYIQCTIYYWRSLWLVFSWEWEAMIPHYGFWEILVHASNDNPQKRAAFLGIKQGRRSVIYDITHTGTCTRK